MQTVPASARSWRVVLMLGVLCAAAAFLSLHALGNLKDRTIALVLHGQKLSITALASGLGMWDAISALVMIAAVLAAVRQEARDRAFSGFLAAAPRGAFVAALSILLAWLGHAYFIPGVLLGGDTGTHIARFLE